MNRFRTLRADEIDCRIAQVKSQYDKDQKKQVAKGLTLLLYKDARCDQNILDETVGEMNWERKHSRENANCTVSIWDSEKQMWISKEDTGTESNTEKEKGLASDSFKRACFNWGIGRELYTAPFVWIAAKDCNIIDDGGKFKCYDSFTVKEIDYKNGCISKLKIKNNKTGKIVFNWVDTEEKPEQPDNEPEQKEVPKAEVTMSNKVPEMSAEMKYLNNELGFMAKERGAQMAQLKAIFSATRKKAVSDGVAPDKAVTEYTIDEIKLILDLMKAGAAA